MRNVWMQVGVGVIGLVAVFATMRSETPKARPSKATSAPVISATPTPAARPVVPIPTVEAPSQPAPSQQVAEAPAPKTPAVALPKGDSEMVRTWLLTASDAEFAPLVGTQELDSAVAQVVNGLSFRESTMETTTREIDDFLTRINGRVQAVASTR